MPTCPRCALVAVALAFLAFTGCDTNNPGRDLDLIDGTYAIAEITFDPDAPAVEDADVDAELNPNVTRLEVYGSDAEAQLTTQFQGESTRSRTLLDVSASRGQARFEAATTDDEEDLARLLLPPQFTLEYVGDNPAVLEATFRRTANLQAFDSDRYSGLTAVAGRLTVRLERQ